MVQPPLLQKTLAEFNEVHEILFVMDFSQNETGSEWCVHATT